MRHKLNPIPFSGLPPQESGLSKFLSYSVAITPGSGTVDEDFRQELSDEILSRMGRPPCCAVSKTGYQWKLTLRLALLLLPTNRLDDQSMFSKPTATSRCDSCESFFLAPGGRHQASEAPRQTLSKLLCARLLFFSLFQMWGTPCNHLHRL